MKFIIRAFLHLSRVSAGFPTHCLVYIFCYIMLQIRQVFIRSSAPVIQHIGLFGL